MLDDDDALGNVILVLIDQVRNDKGKAFNTDQTRFWDLYNNVEVLHEAIVKRARDEPRPAQEPGTPVHLKYKRYTQRMTYRDSPPEAPDQ